jgi:LysM repeat protein
MNKLFFILLLFCSNLLFAQQTIKNLQWLNVDKEIIELTVDNGVTLYAETENIDDGELITITIWLKGNENDELVGDYLSRVNHNKINFHWILTYELERFQNSLYEFELYKFTRPQYYFVIEYNTIKSQNSELLSVMTWMTGQFVYGTGEDELWRNTKIAFIFPDDTRIDARTDAEGRIKVSVGIIGMVAWIPLMDEDEEENEPALTYEESNYPVYYIIKQGDSFWKIAAYDFVYGDPYLWVKLYEANMHNLLDASNPNLIEVGQVLIIPPIGNEIRWGTR